MSKITILGAGSWGIALSVLLTDNHHQVSLWEVNPEQACHLDKERKDNQKLPGILIPEKVEIINELAKAVLDSEVLALALPSHIVREVAQKLAKINLDQPLILNLAKGIENNSLCRMSEVLKQELPQDHSQ